MKRKLTTIYAACMTALLAAGFLLAFVFAMKTGVEETIKCLVGLVYGFVLSPILHELGHVCANCQYGLRLRQVFLF